MIFKDFYSRQAEEYSRYRPTYPDELFQYLNSIISNHELAVDCATGNGQAAMGLSEYFKKVIALDASNAQISNAFKKSNINYKVAKAEDTGIISGSADLVTIATAIHWLDADLFYKEVNRILKDDGVIAIWTYGTVTEIDPEIDGIINKFSEYNLGIHWDRGIETVWSFDKINFPFSEIKTPDFEIKRKWTCQEFLNYLFTWSSVQKYIEVNNKNPVEKLSEELIDVWGSMERMVRWEIKMKAGKKFTNI